MDPLNLAVLDVQAHDVDQAPVGVERSEARLAVDPGGLERDSQALDLAVERDHGAGDGGRADHRVGDRAGPAAAVADEHGVASEEGDETVEIAVAGRGEEAGG